MTGFLALLGAKWGALGKWRAPILIGAVAASALALAHCQGRTAGRTAEQLKQAEAAAEQDRRADKADAKAADTRVDDARQAATEAKELDDATRNAKDADDARHRRGCIILRQQGRADAAAAAGC